VIDQRERVAAARSWLYTPGTQPTRFDRARTAGADGLIIDLEDAVPGREKDVARANAVAFMAASPSGPSVLRAVRINPPSTRAGLRDLDALAGAASSLDAVVVPKCDSAAVVSLVATVFAETGTAPAIIALVESAAAVSGIAELVIAPDLAAIAVGVADLSADLGCTPAWESLAAVRTTLIVHAAAARLPVIDSPFFDLADDAGLRAEASAAADLGFTAKAAIHPRQVAAINAAFAPAPEEIEWAHAVLEVADAGVGLVDGVMVDAAVARRARRILAAIPRNDP